MSRDDLRTNSYAIVTSKVDYKEIVSELREASKRFGWGFCFCHPLVYLAYVHPGDLVLEVGCHVRKLESYIKERGGEYIGADICTYEGKKIHVICDAHHLPFKGETFDCIYSIHVIEHLKNPLLSMHECKRVAKPTGYVIMQLGLDVEDHTHKSLIKKDALYNLCRGAEFNSIVIDKNAEKVLTSVACQKMKKYFIIAHRIRFRLYRIRSFLYHQMKKILKQIQ